MMSNRIRAQSAAGRVRAPQRRQRATSAKYPNKKSRRTGETGMIHDRAPGDKRWVRAAAALVCADPGAPRRVCTDRPAADGDSKSSRRRRTEVKMTLHIIFADRG